MKLYIVFFGFLLVRIKNWNKYGEQNDDETFAPKLFKGILTINEENLVKLPVPADIKNDGNEMESYPRDTYFDFSCGRAESCPWLHGSVFVNGFNVGRYHTAGPLQTLYIPGPLLHQGENEVKS